MDKICLSYWWPRLQASGVPVPRTLIVETEINLLAVLDGNVVPGFADFIEQLQRAAAEMGYPCFLRTGYGSGKHQWPETCYVALSDSMANHVARLVEWSHTVDLLGLPTNVWAVRELLPTSPWFYAFRNMPICRERRYFFQDGQVVCHHPYWPAEAIEASISPAGNYGWRSMLDTLNQEPADEVAMLAAMTETVAAAFADTGVGWSLDWLETAQGWYAIDMAPAEVSWHWPGCNKLEAGG